MDNKKDEDYGDGQERNFYDIVKKKIHEKELNREIVDLVKRLKKGVEGAEYRTPEIIGGFEYSDDEDIGEELFTIQADIDPKFLNHFSTDYQYDELTDEQKEVYDTLFEEGDDNDYEQLSYDNENEDHKHKKSEDMMENESEEPSEQVKEVIHCIIKDEDEIDKLIKEAKGGDLKLQELEEEDLAIRNKIVEREKRELEQASFYSGLPINSEAPKKKVKFGGEIKEEDSDDEVEPAYVERKIKEDEFPTLDIFNNLLEDDIDDDEDDNQQDNLNIVVDEEEEAALENNVKKEVYLENKFNTILKEEYADDVKSSVQANNNEQKISDRQFDAILDEHLDEMKKKNPVLQTEKKITEVTQEGGAKIIFYFGGAKASDARGKKTKGKKLLEESDEGEEEQQGEEEGEEEELDSEEKYEKYLRDLGFGSDKISYIDTIERDAKLPDTINGLKLFKRVLIPRIPYKDDIVAQRVMAEEEDELEEEPPAIYDGRSIREPIISFDPKKKVLTKEEALANSTIIKVIKKKKPTMRKENVVEDEEEEGSSKEEENLRANKALKRKKEETPEERKARKELVKELKVQRKEKKKKFKEKYDEIKKGLLVQHNTRLLTNTTQGVAVYKI